MHYSLILISLAAATQGLYFHVSPLTITDKGKDGGCVDFTVNNPDAVYEQGGHDSATCSLPCSGSPPSCWSHCDSGHGSSAYYARVTPGSYQSASKYSIDIWQPYVYELANHNNGTVEISTDNANAHYECAPQGQYTTCETKDGGAFDTAVHPYYGGSTPADPFC
ncbi:hypothetical protein K470DRAFT_213628 [Piedraia hortae CBS 480.64]|uniref:Uncharacterized protein n=1 Tax=Piedraia hortae CBS 480.64 TaxID=1314780 RepID=A0A6A7C4C4_9PEZI|nr:hypothetical protein K470DRAFT_213628 [Piedraia hortae CBS 480.64]